MLSHILSSRCQYDPAQRPRCQGSVDAWEKNALVEGLVKLARPNMDIMDVVHGPDLKVCSDSPSDVLVRINLAFWPPRLKP